MNDCIAKRGIKGTKDYAGNGQNVIREGILGDAPELLAAVKPDFTKLYDKLKEIWTYAGAIRDSRYSIPPSITQSAAASRLESLVNEANTLIKQLENA